MQIVDFVSFIKTFINPFIVLFVLNGGFFAKRYLNGWNYICVFKLRLKFTMAWKTLVVGTVFNIGYVSIVFATTGIPKAMWLQLFISYIFATSFYELLINPFVKLINKSIGNDQETTP
jgi:hypothetical protein